MAKKRKPLSKKIRFEVFKRDSFTCQYCGQKAPDVVLHVDHIKPVSKGGKNDLINLVTSCIDCNQGKSNRELSDDSVISQNRSQIDDLSDKNEQSKMMIEWLESLRQTKDQEVEYLAKRWYDSCDGAYSLNDKGVKDLKKAIREYGLEKASDAIDTAIEQYYEYDEDGNVTKDSLEKAIYKYIGILRVGELGDDEREVYYIRGILNKRAKCIDHYYFPLMERARELNIDMKWAKRVAISCSSWGGYSFEIEEYIRGQENG